MLLCDSVFHQAVPVQTQRISYKERSLSVFQLLLKGGGICEDVDIPWPSLMFSTCRLQPTFLINIEKKLNVLCGCCSSFAAVTKIGF